MPNNRQLRPLREGFSYGSPIAPLRTNLQVGDLFYVPGTRQCGAFDGKIITIRRTTFTYECTYFDKPMQITTHIYNLVNGFVQRGTIVHPVEYPE